MSALVLISVLGVVLLYLGLFGNRSLLAPVGIVGLLLAFVFFAADWRLENPLFGGLVQFDTYARSFSMVLIVVTVLLFLFGIDYYAKVRENVAEQYALMLFSLIGGLLITSFSNLIVLFLGIEILSIPLYVLVGIAKAAYIGRLVELFAEAGVKVAAFTFSAAAIHGALRLYGAPPSEGFLGLMETPGGVEAYGESTSKPIYSAIYDQQWERASVLASAELRLPENSGPARELAGLLPSPRRVPAEAHHVSATGERPDSARHHRQPQAGPAGVCRANCSSTVAVPLRRR